MTPTTTQQTPTTFPQTAEQKAKAKALVEAATRTVFGDFSLKNLKSLEGEETPCFEAILCEKGQKVAYARNSGTGGSNDYYPVEGVSREQMDAAIARLDAYAKTLPPLDPDFECHDGTKGLSESEETVVFSMVLNAKEAKRLKAAARKNLLYVKPDAVDLASYHYLKVAPNDPRVAPYLTKNVPDAIVLNDAILGA